jgi:hypothetical protein
MVDLRVDLIEDFKVKGFPKAMKSTSKATQVNKLRAFLKEAYRRDWMEEALHLKTRPVKAFYEEKTHTRKRGPEDHGRLPQAPEERSGLVIVS